MKASSKGSLAGCLVHLDAGTTTRLAQQNLQIPENANNRTIPSWLFGARLSLEIDSPLVALMPYWPLPTKKSTSPTTPHLHQDLVTRCHNQDNPAETYTESTS